MTTKVKLPQNVNAAALSPRQLRQLAKSLERAAYKAAGSNRGQSDQQKEE